MKHERRRYRMSTNRPAGEGRPNPYQFGERRHTKGDINFGKLLVKTLPWAIILGLAYWLAEEFIF